MKIDSIKYFSVDALKSLKRNKSLSIASVATVAATLFVLGVFLILLVNLNQAVKGLTSNVQVKIYMNDDITEKEKENIKSTVNSISDVQSIEFENKDKALNNFKDMLGEGNEDLVAGYEEDNPLPTAYIVKVKKPEAISVVVNKVNGLSGIEKIADGRDTVNKIIKVTSTVKWLGIVILFVLIVVSLFLISNTIKITVFSRRREIGIMKFIGATDWFIRWPFVLEGMVIGLIGAVISLIVMYFGYSCVYSNVSQNMQFFNLVKPSSINQYISFLFILIGMLIGIAASIISLRKFLKV